MLKQDFAINQMMETYLNDLTEMTIRVKKLVFKDIDGLTGFLTGSSGFGSSHETDFGSSLILSKFWLND